MTASRLRIEAIDVARGVALVAMGVYHFVWDLSFYNFVPPSTVYEPGFQYFGHIIAMSFLALVGVSLALAVQGGFNLRSYLWRTALVAIAAALVSIGTKIFMPDAFVAFGILHCIVVASLLSLAFLNAPLIVTFGCGIVIILVPLAFKSPAFDALNWFLGIGAIEPRTLDWRPFFPWVGFTLFGLGFAQFVLSRGIPDKVSRWRASSAFTRFLTFSGRNSLAVYLIHQPILLGMVFVASMATSNYGNVVIDNVKPPVEAISTCTKRCLTTVDGSASCEEECDFRISCTLECSAAGPTRDFCAKACDCVVRDSKNVGLWRQVLANSLASEERHRFEALTRACLAPDADMIR